MPVYSCGVACTQVSHCTLYTCLLGLGLGWLGAAFNVVLFVCLQNLKERKSGITKTASYPQDQEYKRCTQDKELNIRKENWFGK